MEQFLKLFQNFKGHFAISEISPVIWGISEAIEIILEKHFEAFSRLFSIKYQSIFLFCFNV